jgi:hypothetical protein
LADGLADLMVHVAGEADGDLVDDVEELREAVGLEERKSLN